MHNTGVSNNKKTQEFKVSPNHFVKTSEKKSIYIHKKNNSSSSDFSGEGIGTSPSVKLLGDQNPKLLSTLKLDLSMALTSPNRSKLPS